jgi:hypothetical protein
MYRTRGKNADHYADVLMLIKVARNMIVFGNNKNKGHKHESQTYTCELVSIAHLTFSINQSINKNHIGGVMVSVIVLAH